MGVFVFQMITYNGFFDSTPEWVGIENVSIIGSACPSNALSVRFCSSLHIYNVSLPQREDLIFIFTSILTAVANEILPSNSRWDKAKLSKLAHTMIAIYNEV